MIIQRAIFAILLATTGSVFASSSSTIQEQDSEAKASVTASATQENKPVQWVELSDDDQSTRKSQTTYIPYNHTLIEKIIKTMTTLTTEESRGRFQEGADIKEGSLRVSFKNSHLPEIQQYLSPYHNLMRQLGTLEKTDRGSLAWTIDFHNIRGSGLADVSRRFLECLLQYIPTPKLDPGKFYASFFIPEYNSGQGVDFLMANKDSFNVKKPLASQIKKCWWVSTNGAYRKREYLPLGSKTILKVSEKSSYAHLDGPNPPVVSLTTFETFEKIRNGHYDPKSAKAFDLLNHWGGVDANDPCVFHIPAAFFTEGRNVELFAKILATIEPSTEESLGGFYGAHVSHKKGEGKTPYDIAF